MSHVHCHSHAIVGQVYKSVVNDTIAAVRSYFLDEGVDEQVLQDLKQLWESKLNQSRAVDLKETEASSQQASKAQRNAGTAQRSAPTGTVPAAPSGGASGGVTTVQPQSLVPIQITIPPQTPGGQSKTIVVQVPVSAVQSGLAGQHLQTILSSAAAQATFALPPDIASNMLQQQLNDALRQSAVRQVAAAPGGGGLAIGAAIVSVAGGCPDSHVGGRRDRALLISADERSGCRVFGLLMVCPRPAGGVQYGGGVAPAPRPLGQLDGASDRCPLEAAASPPPDAARQRADRRLARRLGLRPVQLDGLGDSSDSDDDDDVDDGDDDVDDDDDTVNDEDEEDQGQEEEPLNSEDDVSDHEPADLQETFNVMVCQYDKITRSRNKWKFHLKDGIMNLDGKDYIFQKAGGDAEW
ncbi:transcription initiation factor IIA subunit 1-like [Pollicipes pollicipes]|uniref:transcription initiation factor IIA subunit 1-like n=1 Tax=Pollicipes pollicipes TaxID=41117 RepID=UPI0018859B20|nr:transcription initiation factor IIA subunit 1-like [Pollicipes pollicipes]